MLREYLRGQVVAMWKSLLLFGEHTPPLPPSYEYAVGLRSTRAASAGFNKAPGKTGSWVGRWRRNWDACRMLRCGFRGGIHEDDSGVYGS